MLHEEDQRKAYLHLMTNFIMGEARLEANTPITISNENNKEKVKYMISQPAIGEVELSVEGTQLYNALKTGMTESKVLQLSSKICLERGYVLKSDIIKRLYMHIDTNTQIWVELTQDNIDLEPIVTKISNIELKTMWKVYHNNVLKVAK